MQPDKQTNYRFYTTTFDAWQVMLADCEKAKHSIYFEQYILSDDEWGNKFLNLFLKKAKEGLRITLIFDFMGSMDIRHSPIVKAIRENGGTVKFYRPLNLKNLFFPKTWFPRTHLKCMIIDEEIGYLGSGCVAKRMETWRDTYMRFTGNIVHEMMYEFSIKGKPLKQSHKKFEMDGFNFQINKPKLFSNPVYKDLLKNINKAEDYIYIVTPYFIAPRRLSLDLIKAAKRGVKIVIMSSKVTDVMLADLAARADYKKYLNAGMHLHLFEPTILHSKYAIIDGKWATMGSTNIDYLSLHQNRESNVAITDVDAIGILKNHFIDDLDLCLKVDEAYCEKRHILEKMASHGAKLLKKIL